MQKPFMTKQYDSDINRYKEIRKLTIEQDEDYTTGCLCEYIKNHYKSIILGVSRQKELDADPKAIQQKEFNEQLKNIDGADTDGTKFIFVLTILEKNQ